MGIFINQGASKLFIDFCFVFTGVMSSGGFYTCARVLLLRWGVKKQKNSTRIWLVTGW